MATMVDYNDELAEIKRGIERRVLTKANTDIKVKLNSVANFMYIKSKTAKSEADRHDAMTYVKAIKKAIDIVDIRFGLLLKE